MDQKSLFLGSEGDSWFLRNREAMAKDEFLGKDLITQDVLAVLGSPMAAEIGRPLKLMEIGASNGRRLEWLEKNAKVETWGIEPSAAAVEDAQSHGLRVTRGTAEKLDFPTGEFDIVIFGFCLCMCDTDDLFQIAYEANRVLKHGGWLIIGDFYSQAPVERAYRHVPGVTTRKMDYRQMFTWHPDYVCYSQRVVDHSSRTFTDEPNEWIMSSILRKLPRAHD